MNPFKIIIMAMSLLFASDTPTDDQHLDPDYDHSEEKIELYKPINLDPDPNHAFDAWQSVIQEAKTRTKTTETDKKD